MSNWLGFSLTPHLRIDEGFGRDEQQNQQQEGGGFVMPLRSDGSLCDMDPFRRPSGSEGEDCWNILSHLIYCLVGGKILKENFYFLMTSLYVFSIWVYGIVYWVCCRLEI